MLHAALSWTPWEDVLLRFGTCVYADYLSSEYMGSTCISFVGKDITDRLPSFCTADTHPSGPSRPVDNMGDSGTPTDEARINGAHQSPNTNEQPVLPVLIVGGGVVGALTALRLGQAGIDVDIVEHLPKTSNAPRACGYFAASQLMLKDTGIYDSIRAEGFVTRGLCWRTPPVDDGDGGKRLGEVVANLPLAAPHDKELGPGAGILMLTQAKLNRLMVREALKTGHVRVHFNTTIDSILSNTDAGVKVLTRNVSTGETQERTAKYLVAADGAKSTTRKLLSLPYQGHTWPERLIATNVMLYNREETPMHTYFIMHPTHWAISTPLSTPNMHERTLWRFTMAADPALDHLPDEQMTSDEVIFEHFERCMAAPRPLREHVQIVDRAVYRTHQRLVPTMRKGNVLLAGDAAHW
jgi:2-polyprenyl-6-methoxyphenol hydroxylase-like FAD-dependent oxidoreductase